MASGPPQVRRRPTRAKLADSQRNSDAVRASVLETALELGFTQNSTVADWIFNNPLSEEPEEPHPEPEVQDKHDTKSEQVLDVGEATTPSFTSGSNSTSDESSSLNSPANNASSAAVTTIQVHTHKPNITESPHVHFGDFSADQLQLFSPFALSPHEAHRTETRGDSSGKLLRDNERPHSQDDDLRSDPSQSGPGPCPVDAGYASEGQYLSKGKGSKGKDKPEKQKGSKRSKPKALNTNETGEKDGDYTSDGGYLSASSNRSQGKSSGKVKARAMAFFRRRSKKTGRASDDEDEDTIPPVPAIPILPRPSSPKPLERRATPSSPTRSGFSPLTLNLASPPASPPRRRVSKSPPHVTTRATPPQRSDYFSLPQRPASPLGAPASALTVSTPATNAAVFPLPPSMPSTPLSTASFHTASSPSTQPGAGPASTPKSLTTPSLRQHLSIPPPAPPPTLPLPQLPPSPSILPDGILPPFPGNSTAASRRGVPARTIPVVPTAVGSTRPLAPYRGASPFRPLLSPRIPATLSQTHNGEFPDGSEGEQLNGKEITRRHRSRTALTAGLGSTPAFLQRKIQHGPPPSPRHPPPDTPLPPSPCSPLSARPRTPIGSHSKFHEHLSSVSSVPLSQVLSPPSSKSPSLSTATLSGSSSGLSLRSSHISSASDRSGGPVIYDSLNASRPTTSASTISELSYGQPIVSTFSRPAMELSDRSDMNSSIYAPTTHRDSSSVTTYDDDADFDDAPLKSHLGEEDDDASVYPSEDMTAGRRTMYLVEHGELDANGEEVVMAGSDYWASREAPPPLPPLPPMLTRPGPGYF